MIRLPLKEGGVVFLLDKLVFCLERDGLTGLAGFVNEGPIPELGIITVRIEQRVSSIGRPNLGIGDRVSQPPIVGLTGELENPTRRRRRDPSTSPTEPPRLAPSTSAFNPTVRGSITGRRFTLPK